MSYVLGGSNGESNSFERVISGFALRALRESTGLVNMTTVVQPQQGNTYVIPVFQALSYQDYNPAGTGGFEGDAEIQNPSISQASITATPMVASTVFDTFAQKTFSYDLAATLGAELGDAYGEKVDQRITAGFKNFKATPGNTNMSVTPLDGYARPTALGAMELRAEGATGGTATAGFTATSVLELVRQVKQNWKKTRNPGNPVIVLDVDHTMNRLLGELTGGAVTNNLSDLGNELLRTGAISNIYGCTVLFTTWLSTASRAIAGGAAENVLVGAYFGQNSASIYTVIKSELEIKMGDRPGGLSTYITGIGYAGSSPADMRRGGAVNIELVA